MEVSLTTFILGILGSGTFTAVVLKLVDYYTGKNKEKVLTKGQEIKNAKDQSELLEELEKKTAKMIKEKLDESESMNHLKQTLAVEVNTRKIQGDALIQLAKDIGASQNAEKQCKEDMAKLRNEWETDKKIREARSNTHDKRVLDLLENICEKVKA